MRGEGRGRAGAGAGHRSAAPPLRGPNPRPERRPAPQLLPASSGLAAAGARGPAEGHFLACKWLFVVLPAVGGGRGTGGSVSARGGARARFLPPAPSTSCRLHSEEKGRRKSWAATPVRVGDGRAGAGRLSGGGSGTAATPAPRPGPTTPRSPGAAAAPARTKCVPPGGGGAGPRGDGHRARWVGGGESARGAAWGGGGANTRCGGRPEPGRGRGVASPEPGGSRGSPSSREGEERERGWGGRGAARRGGDPTLPSWPGQRRRRRRRRGGCIIATLSPRRQLGSPTPESPGGQRPRVGGH